MDSTSGKPENRPFRYHDSTRRERFQHSLFTNELSLEQKKNVLKNEYHIDISPDMEKEMEEMCNMSEGLCEWAMNKGIEQGIEQGMQQGKKQGMEQGMEQKAREDVIALLNFGMTEDQIAAALKQPVEQIQTWNLKEKKA